MKKLKHRIFIRLLFVIVVILGISMFCNIRAQRNLYIDYARESYMGYEQGLELQELMGIGNNYKRLSHEEAVKKIIEFNAKESISISKWKTRNMLFFVGRDYHDADAKNEIIDYTFYSSYSDNYIYLMTQELGYHDFSIQNMPKEKRESLLSYLISHMNVKDEDGIRDIYVEYGLNGEELIYLKWENDEYGQKPNHTDVTYINNFCIDGNLCWYDRLNEKDIIINVNELLTLINTKTYPNTGSYAMAGLEEISYKGNMYFISTVLIGGNGLTEEPLVNAYFINVVEDFEIFVITKHLEENLWLYVISFILLMLTSYGIANMISKPVVDVEKIANRISDNEFGNEIKVTSKDEIGSLQASINKMQNNLKNTIDQLNQEIQKVKELESLRKDFINQFTHEMKTPLGIINGYSELIEEAENDEEKQKYLDIINRETNRINDLIQSMLKLSRLEAGKVELNKEVLDLEDLITEVIDEFEVLLMKKNIKVEVNIVDKNIIGDKHQLTTVIRNFISNAIKHTDSKIVITVDKGIKVFNEGVRIDEDKINGIWYTFVTHDKTGTGLGLAICRSILELHQYQYGVKNKQNGVEFYFFE